MILWKLIGLLRKKKQISLSIFVSFLSMIIDGLSLIMIYELISTLEAKTSYVSLDRISDITGLTLPEYKVSLWAMYVGLITIMANVVRALNMKLIINITYDCEQKINEIIFERKILGPFSRFIIENQFDDQKEILNEAMIVVVQGIRSLTLLFLGFCQVLGIMAGLFITEPTISFMLFLSVSTIYLFTFLLLRKPISITSITRSEADTKRIGLLNEAFTNIKQIKVSRDEQLILNSFIDYAKRYTSANAKAKWLGIAPKFIIEGTILAGIAFIAAILLQLNGSLKLPSIASVILIAIAAGKLIPEAQKIYTSFVNISYSSDATNRIFSKIKDLVSDQGISKKAEFGTNEAFELRVTDLHYIYPSHDKPTIEQLSFTLTSGQLSYLVGPSGSGKSTVCDLITGLLTAKNGKIEFNSVKNGAPLKPIVRYIPQDSFLMTGSVAFNLFTERTPSNSKLQRARQLLIEFSLAKDELQANLILDTEVKEFGRNFSGGQRQRLSIIRGLLDESNVLILDEPFSALDNSSSQSVLKKLQKILKPEILILIITHDISLIGDNKCVEINPT